MQIDAMILYETALEQCLKLQKENIEYKALYLSIKKELEELKQNIGE